MAGSQLFTHQIFVLLIALYIFYDCRGVGHFLFLLRKSLKMVPPVFDDCKFISNFQYPNVFFFTSNFHSG